MSREHFGHFRADNVTDDELMAWSGQLALHDIVATRRRRFVGHILRLPATRPASLGLWNRSQKVAGGGLEDQRGHDKTC